MSIRTRLNILFLTVITLAVATGVGALWFSPFGPLEVFWGLPLDPLDDEKSSVFEFNMGGSRN